VNVILDALIVLGRGLAAVLAALLPRRYWKALPALPIERLAGLSALLAFLAGVVAGEIGFMSYAARAAGGVVNASFHIAARQARGEIPGEITTMTTQGVSALSLFAFLFFTPLGLFSFYLVATGLLRAAGSFVDDPFGDPILTGVDALATRSARRLRRVHVRRAREHREGPEVPDRLLAGDGANLAGFDYVVVSSRRKPDWTAGTFVITSDRWYTLGQPFDIQLPDGLRTVYPLREQKVTEVLRRAVRYELPPLEQEPLSAVLSHHPATGEPCPGPRPPSRRTSD
jgi:hypothetical protein